MTRGPTCRLCLSTEGVMEDIFAPSDLELHELIYECTDIEVKNVFGLPSSICEVCKSALLISHKFRQKCLKSNMILKIKFPELFKDPIPEDVLKFDHEDELIECVKIMDEEYEDFEQVIINNSEEYSSIQVYYHDKLPKQIKKENSPELETSVLQSARQEEYNDESSTSEVMLKTGSSPTGNKTQINNILYEHLVRISDGEASKFNEDFKQEIDAKSLEVELPQCKLEIVKKEYNEESNELKVIPVSCMDVDPEENENQINEADIEFMFNGENFNQEINKSNHEVEIPLRKLEMINNEYSEETNNIKDTPESDTDLLERKKQVLEMSGENLLGKMLTKSEQRVHKYNDEKSFECKDCRRVFRQKLLYQYHVCTHKTNFPTFASGLGFTKERRFPCDLCDKSYAYGAYLAEHQQSHDIKAEKKRYKCKYCGKVLIGKSTLTKHVNQLHAKGNNTNVVSVRTYLVKQKV